MNTEGAVKGLDPFIHVHQAEGMSIKAVLLGVKAPPVVKNLELDEAGVVRDNHINFVWRCVPQSIVNGFLADPVKNVLDVSRQLVGTGVANYVNRNSRIFLQPFGEGLNSRNQAETVENRGPDVKGHPLNRCQVFLQLDFDCLADLGTLEGG